MGEKRGEIGGGERERERKEGDRREGEGEDGRELGRM